MNATVVVVQDPIVFLTFSKHINESVWHASGLCFSVQRENGFYTKSAKICTLESFAEQSSKGFNANNFC